ncbi:MAG: prolyl oligopeptidase family serine peptidase, partial [Armatimonadetes bacterium]|nr:prolyl oligopeptidase family serine peptidase [Armatimonadota bacterium]
MRVYCWVLPAALIGTIGSGHRMHRLQPGLIVPNVAMVISRVGRYGRIPVHQDAVEAEIVAGTWKPPHSGDTVTLPDGKVRTWTLLNAAKNGSFTAPGLGSGYADIEVNSPSDTVMLLNASHYGMVYVNGQPRAGDPYGSGYLHLPVRLRAGRNDFLFATAGSGLQMSLTAPTAPQMLDTGDITTPDYVIGARRKPWAALEVENATASAASGLRIRAARDGAGSVETAVPEIGRLTVRKVGFRLPSPPSSAGPPVAVTVRLMRGGHTLSTAKITINRTLRDQLHKITFVSGIDGSVQYYAIQPAHPLPGDHAPRALDLSLHGAGVEALGQAASYEPKTWIDIVAPTNRRPFGFDWEDWGRLDAEEVLALAEKSLKPDPTRIFLSGHSMGGHGAWTIGANDPDPFAAICPSAGWLSFRTYVANAVPPYPASAVGDMLNRAWNDSDTSLLVHNYKDMGVFIIHGSKDDNVPVTEAIHMTHVLATFHHDWVFYEQPGASHWWDASDEPGTDCVDLMQLWDFFARHRRPEDGQTREVELVTVNPGITAWRHWLGIIQQIHPYAVSKVTIHYDPGLYRFTGTTVNVRHMQLKVNCWQPAATLKVVLDGQTLKAIPWPRTGALDLERRAGRWSVSAPVPAGEKNPLRSGPFKDAFKNDMEFVYGTGGTPSENRWAYGRARFDAETFWYRGNGSVDVVADTAFNATAQPQRSIILYG